MLQVCDGALHFHLLWGSPLEVVAIMCVTTLPPVYNCNNLIPIMYNCNILIMCVFLWVAGAGPGLYIPHPPPPPLHCCNTLPMHCIFVTRCSRIAFL